MINGNRQAGFTLIEIAIVVVIVAVLLGYTVALFPVQQDLKHYREANRELESALEHLIAYAQINGRLPCPDTSGGSGAIDGYEDPGGAQDCQAFYGFLPARTLGMRGDFDASGVLLDPWGSRYRYAVSDADAGDTNKDLVIANNVRAEGMAAVIPNLVVCDDSPNTGDDNSCTDASSNDVITNVAVVVLSLGKDRGTIASNIQIENTDNFHDGQDDRVFVWAGRSDSGGAEFDDVVKWMSPILLFSRMIAAEQLP